jgi:hypothetical protein
LQDRVIIGDFNGFSNVEFELESNAAKVGIPLTEKIYIFICIGLIKIYILFMKPNQPYDEMYVWEDLISFDYVQIISMMFKNWCMSERC